MRHLILVIFTIIVLTSEAHGTWEPLAAGMELGSFDIDTPSPVGDSKITILRIDPKRWELVLIGKSWDSESEVLTARDWCKKHNLTAAIKCRHVRYRLHDTCWVS
jgi:hypothetical protein